MNAKSANSASTPSETPPNVPYVPFVFVRASEAKRGSPLLLSVRQHPGVEGSLEMTLVSINGKPTRYLFGSMATSKIEAALKEKA